MSSTQQLLLGEGAGGGPANYIEDVFSTYLYKGNSSTQTITNGIDLSTKGGLVWSKYRTSSFIHNLFDTARGVQKTLCTNDNSAEATETGGITAFNSNGYTVGSWSQINSSSGNFVSWTFREQPKFFDIVTWSGNDVAGREIAHNLGSTPGMVIIKSRVTDDWVVWHRSLTSGNYIVLNSTAAQTTGAAANRFGNGTTTVDPTATVFTVGNNGTVNQSGNTYVAYLFAHNAGGFGLTGSDNVISCGSTTLAGAGVETVTLGYEPQLVLWKEASGVGNWQIVDVMRGMSQSSAAFLQPNGSSGESSASGTPYFAATATGFSTQDYFGSGTYIYVAIRRGPMKVPTLGTDVFDADFGNNVTVANTSVFSSAITTDLLLYLNPAGAGPILYDRLRGGDLVLQTNTTGAETTGGFPNFDTQTGVNSDTTFNFTSRVGDVFRRAPGYFDIVCYTGTGVTLNVTHNLAAVPELMIVKGRSSASAWDVYSQPTGNTNVLRLSTTAAASGQPQWNDTTPTSTVFTVKGGETTNVSGRTYVAYLFATCAGVSKVGSYTGTASTQTINCGFTGGARFVLIKRSDVDGYGWYIWDTTRGMTAGNDPHLKLNDTDPENNVNWVYTVTTGFQIVTTDASVNASGGTYIFLAIA